MGGLNLCYPGAFEKSAMRRSIMDGSRRDMGQHDTVLHLRLSPEKNSARKGRCVSWIAAILGASAFQSIDAGPYQIDGAVKIGVLGGLPILKT